MPVFEHVKKNINQQYLKSSILPNLNNFHSLEVVDRASETQLQVGENSNWIIGRLKGWLRLQRQHSSLLLTRQNTTEKF